MVNSQVTSITPASHADRHRHGGADPLTGNVDINTLFAHGSCDVTLWKGVNHGAWTDIDVSSTVGNKISILILKILNNTAGVCSGALRAKGDTGSYDIWNKYAGGWRMDGGNGASVIFTLTDTDGIFQVKGGQTHCHLFGWINLE